MNENLKMFLQKVAADEEKQAKMQSFTDMDEAYEYAATVQDGFTKEEFTELMTKIKGFASQNNDEINDDDLANVAGGTSTSACIARAATAATAAVTMSLLAV